MSLKNLVKTSFSRFCKNYDKEATLQRNASQHLVYIAKDYLKGEILDLGCGTGFIGEFLERKLIGLDISKSMLEIAMSKGYITIQGDIENLPFKKESFDVVLSNFSLHWLDLDKAFSEVYRILNKNGYFIFNLPIENTLSAVEKITGKRYFNFLDRKEVLNLTTKYFEIEDYEILNYKLKFSNGFELLKHLHNTGVNINPKKSSFKEKRYIVEKFRKFNKEIYLNYNLIFIKSFKNKD